MKDVLKEIVINLDLIFEEKVGLDLEIFGLELMLEKLEKVFVYIVVFGMVGWGKFLFFNVLLGEKLFEIGFIYGVIKIIKVR